MVHKKFIDTVFLQNVVARNVNDTRESKVVRQKCWGVKGVHHPKPAELWATKNLLITS